MLAVCVLAIAVVACASPSALAPSTVTTVAPATQAVATAALISSPAPSAATVVFCGTFVLENPGALGTYMLTPAAAARLVVFRTVSSRGLPDFGSYACARFTAGSARQVGGLSLTEFVAFVDQGEAGYITKP
jgi:hypothetical protein